MSVAYAGYPSTWDYLLHTWRELDVPDGWRPELTVEGITMTPPPGGSHNLIADWVHRALLPVTPDGCAVFQTQGVGVEAAEGIYVPDFCVVPRVAVPPGSDPAPAGEVLLVVEITSPSNAEHDRKKKKWAYAHGRIPQYLLIDRFDEEGPAVSLFSDPADGAYRKATRVAFGQSIKIGAPFDIELDTTQF